MNRTGAALQAPRRGAAESGRFGGRDNRIGLPERGHCHALPEKFPVGGFHLPFNVV